MYKLGWIFLFLISALSCSSGGSEVTNTGNTNSDPPESNWSIPIEEVQDGGPGRDGIPSLSNPIMISVVNASNYIIDQDFIIGVMDGDNVIGFPMKIMDYHEIVNFSDKTLSYCPLTGSPSVWKIEDSSVRKDFGVSGLLYNSNLILFDKETDSNWSQMLLECVEGELLGDKPTLVNSVVMTWENWKISYPDSMIMSDETGYDRTYDIYPYGSYRTGSQLLFPVNFSSDALHQKTIVLGISDELSAKAYPMDLYESGLGMIKDTMNSSEFIVIGDLSKWFMAAYSISDSEGLTYDFSLIADDFPNILLDSTGSVWDIFGRCISGVNQGKQLERVNSIISYWFAWFTFHNETDIYGQK